MVPKVDREISRQMEDTEINYKEGTAHAGCRGYRVGFSRKLRGDEAQLHLADSVPFGGKHLKKQAFLSLKLFLSSMKGMHES